MSINIHEREFGENSIPSLFVKYALPGVIAMMFIAAQVIIDGLIVGIFLGENALAAVGFVSPLYSIFVAITIVIGIGSQTLVSIAQGEGNYQKARNATTSGAVAIVLISLTLSSVILIWSEEILRQLGCSDLLMPHATNYLNGVFILLIGIGISMFNDYILRSTGHPRFSMVFMASAVILNTILNIIFITVCDLGTFGIGIATGIAFTLSGIISTVTLQNRKQKIQIWSGKFKAKLLGNIIYNGSSEGVNEFAAGFTIILFNYIIMRHWGETGVAALSVINYIYIMGICILVGAADSITPIVSYNYGALKLDRCRAMYKFTGYINAAIGILLAFILAFFNRQIIGLFFDDTSKDVIDLASRGAAIYGIAFLFNGYNILTSGFFTAIADAKRSVIISFLRGFVLISIMIIIIPKTIGIDYIWFSVPISEIITTIISITLYRKLKLRWKFKR